MFKWFDNFLKPYQIPESDEYSLDELCYHLSVHVRQNEERIAKLEAENVELTNALYEVENRLQAQIDNIHPVVYNLKDYTLDK
jgi:hypothetical protein